MKKAYLIMGHKSPKQIYRLLDRLNDELSHFFIHIDRKVDITPFKTLEDFGDKVTFLERYNSEWGKYGLTLPLLEGLKSIKMTGQHFDRILLLSGQDYPIKSKKQINEFFENSPYSVFINFFPIPNMNKWPGKDRGGLYRVDKYYFGTKWYELFLSKSLNLVSRYIPLLRRRVPDQMLPYAGETWINLDMYALNYIVDYVEQHPEYLRFHRHTFVADEVFIHMLIGNSTDQKLLDSIEKSEKRFTIWESPKSAHPKVLQKSDFEHITSSEDLFARKFDLDKDEEVLDLIDREILFRD